MGVVTPLMWKSLDICSKFYAHLWANPVEWDVEGKKFITTKPAELITYYLIVFVMLIPLLLLCIVILSAEIYGRVDLSMVEVTLVIFWAANTGFAVLLELIMLVYARNISHALNCAISLERKVPKQGRGWVFHNIFLEGFFTFFLHTKIFLVYLRLSQILIS